MIGSVKYSKVKSKFIKQKIKGIKWKDRGYVDDLIDIEKCVLGKMYGLGTGYIRKHLEDKYPKEWKIIHQELDPKQYKRALAYEKRERERERREDEKFEKEELKELRESKREWIKVGGKV